MAISAPRQRTTFKKDKKTGKVKGTTTYRAPEMEKASEQLDRYIRDNQNKKNCVETLGNGVYSYKSLSWKLDNCNVPK